MNMFSRRASKQAFDNESTRGLIVRPIEPPGRPTAAPIERLNVSSLARESAIPFQLLGRTISHVKG